MKFRHLFLPAAAVLWPLQGAIGGGVSVSFDDPESFEDFTLHEQRSTEKAVTIFEKQIKEYWDRRLKNTIPDGWSLELTFTDIDMAGDIQPWRHPTNNHLRYYADRFFPRLFFKYTLRNAEGSVAREGETMAWDKNFLFGGSGKMIRDEFVFGYELEALRKWLEKLDLTGDRS